MDLPKARLMTHRTSNGTVHGVRCHAGQSPGVALSAVCRVQAQGVGGGQGPLVADRLVTYGAVVLFFGEVTLETMTVSRGAEASAMGFWFIVLVAFETCLFFVTDRTTLSIPGCFQSMEAAIPGDGVAGRFVGGMTLVTMGFLIVALGTELRVYPGLLAVGVLPHIEGVVRNPGAIPEFGNRVTAYFFVTC